MAAHPVVDIGTNSLPQNAIIPLVLIVSPLVTSANKYLPDTYTKMPL